MSKGLELLNGFTDRELDAAFDLVKDRTNWKMPINKIVYLDKTTISLECILESIIFYTGGEGDVYYSPTNPKKVRIQSPGYYNCIGA